MDSIWDGWTRVLCIYSSSHKTPLICHTPAPLPIRLPFTACVSLTKRCLEKYCLHVYWHSQLIYSQSSRAENKCHCVRAEMIHAHTHKTQTQTKKRPSTHHLNSASCLCQQGSNVSHSPFSGWRDCLSTIHKKQWATPMLNSRNSVNDDASFS